MFELSKSGIGPGQIVRAFEVSPPHRQLHFLPNAGKRIRSTWCNLRSTLMRPGFRPEPLRFEASKDDKCVFEAAQKKSKLFSPTQADSHNSLQQPICYSYWTKASIGIGYKIEIFGVHASDDNWLHSVCFLGFVTHVLYLPYKTKDSPAQYCLSVALHFFPLYTCLERCVSHQCMKHFWNESTSGFPPFLHKLYMNTRRKQHLWKKCKIVVVTRPLLDEEQDTLIGKINRSIKRAPMKHKMSSLPCTKPLCDLR